MKKCLRVGMKREGEKHISVYFPLITLLSGMICAQLENVGLYLCLKCVKCAIGQPC